MINFEIAACSIITEQSKRVVDGGRLEQDIKTIAEFAKRIEIDIKMTARDRRKVGEKLKKAKDAMRFKKLGNSHLIDQILGMIERIKKMSPKALDNPELQDQVINELWTIYSDIEINGLDDTHFIESHIPCSDRGLGWLFYQPTKRAKRTVSTSVFTSEEQSIILEAYYKFK